MNKLSDIKAAYENDNGDVGDSAKMIMLVGPAIEKIGQKEKTLDEEALRDFINREFRNKNIDEILYYLETDKGLEYLESCVCNLVGEVGMQIDDSTYQNILDYLENNL